MDEQQERRDDGEELDLEAHGEQGDAPERDDDGDDDVELHVKQPPTPL